jgi:hypothetical protein
MLARKRQRPKVGQTRGDGKSKNKSWMPGRRGQGGEGLSDGYGGSAGNGTGASGPADKHGESEDRGDHSSGLPSRDRIAKVLR